MFLVYLGLISKQAKKGRSELAIKSRYRVGGKWEGLT